MGLEKETKSALHVRRGDEAEEAHEWMSRGDSGGSLEIEGLEGCSE